MFNNAMCLVELSSGKFAVGYLHGIIDIRDPANSYASVKQLDRVQFDSILSLLQLSNDNLWSGSKDNTIVVYDASFNYVFNMTDHTGKVVQITEVNSNIVASASPFEVILWRDPLTTPYVFKKYSVTSLNSFTILPGLNFVVGDTSDLLTEYFPGDWTQVTTAQGQGGGSSNMVLYSAAANGVINSESTSTVEVWGVPS